MPQETNLNVAPYFDDFKSDDNYHKILFKPGFPVQARELTGIQSILQNQIEKFGSHMFKDGSSVTGGGVVFSRTVVSLRINNSNQGISIDSEYLSQLKDKVVVGSQSGVKAHIKSIISPTATLESWSVLLVSYLNTGGQGNETFINGESLLLDKTPITFDSGITIQPGESVAQLLSGNAVALSATAALSAGIYFIRGYFVDINNQIICIDPYKSRVDCHIGLRVNEEIITPAIDSTLNDNAAGFNNYTAPGADRLSIEANLTSIPYGETKPSNFIELMEVRNGEIVNTVQNTKYNELAEEFARRTFDESGNYYVNPFALVARNTLNDYEGNNGLFSSQQLTYNGKVPSEDLGSYKFSPGKAYIEGYEVKAVSPTFLDFQKPRTTKTLEDQSINYVTGPTFTLNNVSGSPILGIGTDYTVSLRDQRIGAAATTAAGKEIGIARVYDFALESGSYDASNSAENEWDIALYDIQTYTNLTLNTATTLRVPTHVKGKSSGATGYLRYDVNVGTGATVYNTKGKFIPGEQFIFNGVESGNVAAASTTYTTSDIKSIHGTVSTASTFNSDVKQTLFSNIGEVNVSSATTSGASLGISTVTFTDPNKFFVGIVTVGNIVEYTNTNSGLNTTSYARVESVSQRSLTISGITTVPGICEGGLPTVIAGDPTSGSIKPSDFKVLTSQFQSSTDNNLYTKLPKNNISDVDLTNSSIVIRKQFDVTITNAATGAINSGSAEETFLPFDEERYVLIRTDGTIESLSSDKFTYNTGSTEITIHGLGGDSPAKLIATLRKINVKEKIKEKKKINILTVVGSAHSTSGIGTTTLNDGLSYNTVYGTRVQDEEISLNVPDVTTVYGVFESTNASAPTFPIISLSSINSATAKTGDLLIGEKFVGQTSNFKGIYVTKESDTTIGYIALNDYTLQVGEIITFEESSITATVSSLILGSHNISKEFTYDNGQRNTIYDYSRLIRKPDYDPPTKSLKIIFQSAYFTSSDTGDITTASSYDNFKYKNLPSINDTRVSDIIDIRPRVSDFSGTTYSPFEFLGRNFTASGNSAKNILASDESSVLDYSFYLPRLDKIYLSKTGDFQLMKGIPAESPEWPNGIDGALEVASVTLPPYLYNISDASIELANYKRYQMSDINKLEKRIENLEFYTSLSLLESDTLNLQITDVDGLNRFKSGFFVDDFSTTDQQIKTTIVKNAIDYKNGELRPSPYTTELDLLLDLNSANGIRKTGRLLSLDYEDVRHLHQPYATRVENVTPYLVNYFGGTVQLLPSSDLWVDQVVLEATREELTTYTETNEQVEAGGFDERSGFGPVTWGAWQENWTGYQTISSSSSEAWVSTGSRSEELIRTTHTTQQRTGSAARKRTRSIVRETFNTVNEGPKVINTEIGGYLRSRNIEFDAKRLRPDTTVYGFFDGEDINKYMVPKLLEITMTTGTFSVGETVIGTNNNGKELIRFKVAQSNHKRGPFDDPTETYTANPYYQFTPLFRTDILIDNIIPISPDDAGTIGNSLSSSTVATIAEAYSSTSGILNVDTTSLSAKSDNAYHGYIEKGLKLVGQTSNAQASINELRLRTDSVGSVIGSFFVPNPNDIVTPKFNVGKKVFRLSSSKINSQVPGNVTCDATETFEATGRIETVQSNIITIKNLHTYSQTQSETKTITGETTTSSHQSSVGSRSWPPPIIRPPVIVGPGPCPTPDMTILLSDGSTKPAGELKVGDEVDTLHEDTLDRGNHKVTYAEIIQSSILELDFSGRKIKCSTSHKFYSNNEWVEAQDLVVGQKVSLLSGEVEFTGSTDLGQGDVVRIQIEDAHTYICEGFLSHNKTPPPIEPPPVVGPPPPKPTPIIIDPPKDAVHDAYMQVMGGAADAGGKRYWAEQAAKEGATTYAEIKKAVVKHLEFSAEGRYRATTGRTREADIAAGTNIANEAEFQQFATSIGQGDYQGKNHRDPETGERDTSYYEESQANPSCPEGRTDPLAQSFFVPQSEGIFVTKTDIYIASKDEYLPLVVQIRPMKLGLPTTEILAFGEVVLDPADVNISEDASVATTVTFPSPVYLTGNSSYAVVLLSTSNNYTAWISRMGEVDIQTVDSPESEQIIVSTQPTLGSLFKSQNGEIWNPSQYEDLKFTLYRARFTQSLGNVNFTNPSLLTYTDDVGPLLNDSFNINSNKIRVGFNTTISDGGITIGNLVQQDGSNATGRYVGYAGTATGNLTITNAGVGYTPSSANETYHHVPLVTITGAGRNATAAVTIQSGVAAAATITNGGSGYVVGDVVGVSTLGFSSLGKDIKFSIASLTGTNEFILDNVQGEFVTGVGKTFKYTTGAGVTVLNYSAGGNVWLSESPVVVNDGMHIKVNQKNHGMYSSQDVVTFSDVKSDILPTKLASDYDSASTGSLIVDDGTEFASFENVGVGSTNLGYIKVGEEILSYGGVTNNTLTSVVRGVDSTKTLSHNTGDLVNKYELNGVSLRRINTNHNLANATVSNARGLDYYNVKIDTSSNGVDRSVGTSLPILHFNETKSVGGDNILATENIPFEVVTPIVQNITPSGSDLTAQIRTITRASVDGSEQPFVDKGFEDISLITDNYMSSPRMIASRINETTSLPNLPDNKSFTLNLAFHGLNFNISPMVDLDRIGVILTSNRLNNPITNWLTDNRVKTLRDDPNSFVYASTPVTLESGATGIKIHMAGHINLTSDIRAFYAISESPNDELIYQPFPGYDNLLTTGQVIDPAKNSGLPDKALPKTDVIAYTSDQVVWKDYEFSVDDLPTFRCFSIKLIGTGTNQAQPPRMKNLRVIALA